MEKKGSQASASVANTQMPIAQLEQAVHELESAESIVRPLRNQCFEADNRQASGVLPNVLALAFFLVPLYSMLRFLHFPAFNLEGLRGAVVVAMAVMALVGVPFVMGSIGRAIGRQLAGSQAKKRAIAQERIESRRKLSAAIERLERVEGGFLWRFAPVANLEGFSGTERSISILDDLAQWRSPELIEDPVDYAQRVRDLHVMASEALTQRKRAQLIEESASAGLPPRGCVQ